MKEKNKVFILIVLVYTCQVLMSYSISWNILKNTSNKIPLAACLSISAVIPYALQSLSSKLRRYIEKSTKKFLIGVVISGILICICFLFLDYERLSINYILMAFTSAIFFLLTQTVEYIVSVEVLYKKRTSNEASKALNIASNIAGLLGALINGVFMRIEGVKTITLINILLFIIILVIAVDLKEMKYDVIDVGEVEESRNKSINKRIIYVYCLFILLAVSTTSTNILLMELLQNELDWGVMKYGIIDALAGVGAVVGVYILNNKLLKNVSKVNVVGLFIVFIVISINTSFIIMSATLFLWGVFMAAFSVEAREVMFKICSNKGEAQQVTKQVIWIKTITNAIAPLIIGVIFIDIKASISIRVVGLFLFITLTIIKVLDKNINYDLK